MILYKKSKISGLVIIYLILCYLKDYLNELIPENIYSYSLTDIKAEKNQEILSGRLQNFHYNLKWVDFNENYTVGNVKNAY